MLVSGQIHAPAALFPEYRRLEFNGQKVVTGREMVSILWRRDNTPALPRIEPQFFVF
jgi:hypothetical protein